MSDKKSDYDRFSGVLMHPTSLPNPYCFGGFGKEAREWLKLLSKNGIGVWQFLPLSPTDESGSPYSSPSSFAINTWFLDVDDLLIEGFLLEEDIKNLPIKNDVSKDTLDEYFLLANKRSKAIGRALRECWESQSSQVHNEFKDWSCKQLWLEDHTLFMQIRYENKQLPWWEWPSELANYNKLTLSNYKKQKKEALLEHSLLQWHLYRQWNSLRNLARELGVLLFGDLPFYVSRDSADVWSNRSLFSMLSDGSVYQQSGVPPDYFSETGQLWGNPVYRWKRHQLSNFRWWKQRFARQFEQVDLLRIDHFRAFKALWKVSGRDETAQNGYWSPSPGLKILSLLRRVYGKKLPLVAEDLGVITQDVEKLRDYFNLPGMKILQFAFDGNPDNPYLPENINTYNAVVYTGTHDNSTTETWWNQLNQDIKEKVSQRVSGDSLEPSWRLIEIGLSTKSILFVAPIQDLLSLNDEARFNTPGTLGGNWIWKLEKFDDTVIKAIVRYGQKSRFYGRFSENVQKLIGQ